jgi:hypothetical protein
MGWREREKHHHGQTLGRSGYDGDDSDGWSDPEKRAADILRRLGAGNGTDAEVVNDFLRRVDDRAEEIKRDRNDGKKRWW